MAAEGPGPGAERPSDFRTSVNRWNAELEAAEKISERWRKDAKRISERYTLEKRSQSMWDGYDSTLGDFNILHSNIQTMLPAVFGREPIPVVMRRHMDPDPVARLAAQILERALKTELETDNLLDIGSRVALDLLLVGRGVPWVRYSPKIGTVEEQGEILTGARTPIDYILWSDFLHAPKTTWTEVANEGWVARRVSMTRDQGIKRFGDKFKECPLRETGAGMEDREDWDERREVIGRASVWELWDAQTKTVYWFCRDYQDAMLDERPDPLSIDGFFPCPMPAFGTVGNAKMVPTPDYLQYEKLADELDRQTMRISVLSGALRVAGIYDASMEGLGQLLSDDGESQNRLIPVTNFNAVQGQGLDGAIQFLPLDAIAEALVGLYDARQRTKDILYEVSGLSDIMRGQVDPREKLGQSRLKGQFASQRLQSKVQVMEQTMRDALRIKAEIMAEHYEPQHLRQLSGYDFMPETINIREQAAAQAEQMAQQMQQQMQQAQEQGMPPQPMPQLPDPAQMAEQAVEQAFQTAVQLLKDEKMRGFRLDIETNSTLLIDDDEEKQRRSEFIESAGSFLERSLPLAMQVPQVAPLLLDMLLFNVRGFRAGRQLEASFEQAVETLKAPPPEEEGPSPEEQQAQMQMQMEQQKSEMEMQVLQAKSQADMQTTQANMQVSQADMQVKMMEMQIKRSELEARMQAEQAKVQTEAQLGQAEIETKLMELDIEREKMQNELEAQRQGSLAEIAKAEAMKEVAKDEANIQNAGG